MFNVGSGRQKLFVHKDVVSAESDSFTVRLNNGGTMMAYSLATRNTTNFTPSFFLSI